MANGPVMSDETAERYAHSLRKGMRVERIVRMIQRDNLRGYERNGEWYLDSAHTIRDPTGVSRANRTALGLFIVGVVLLGLAPSVLFSDWGIVDALGASDQTRTVLVGVVYGIVGLLGLGAMGLSVATHLRVLRHREEESARMATSGYAIGKLGRNSSQVALVLFGCGLFLVLRSIGVVGVTAGLVAAEGWDRVLHPLSVLVVLVSVLAMLIATTEN